MKQFLFQKMMEAIEERNQKELEFLMADKEAKKLQAAYRAYVNEK